MKSKRAAKPESDSEKQLMPKCSSTEMLGIHIARQTAASASGMTLAISDGNCDTICNELHTIRT